MYNIESSIPEPQEVKPVKPRKYPFDKMNPGDSFLIKCDPSDKTRARRNVYSAMKTFVARYHPDWFFIVRVNKDGVRIWRQK
jgi:hypothetical protein